MSSSTPAVLKQPEDAESIRFSLEFSGNADASDLEAVVRDLVDLDESIYGSVVVNGTSYDSALFRAEEPVATPQAAPKSEAK